jgi:perosamine synthetase
MTYGERVRRSFAALKSIDEERELGRAALPLAEAAGSLVPVCRLHLRDRELIELLGAWRVRNMDVYPTQFPVSFEGTEGWLRERLLAVPDRILFLICEPGGRPIGHGGIDEALADPASARLDNVMRGVDDAPPGIMRNAVAALIEWTWATIAPEAIWAKVFSDNEPVIRLLHGLGFEDQGLSPLRRVQSGDRITFEPAADGAADRHHLRIVLTPSPLVRHP